MLNVLIVDDEPLVLEMLRHRLPWNRFDMEVCGQAADGLAAIEFLKSSPVDIVFTDIKMPHMGGLELIRHTHEFLPRVIFVAVSSYDDYNLVRASFRDGVFDYILKIDIDDMQVVAPLLERVRLCAAAQKKILPRDFSPGQILMKIGKSEEELASLYFCMATMALDSSSNAVWVSEILFFLKADTADFVFGFFDWKIVILCYHNEKKALQGIVYYLLSQIQERVKSTVPKNGTAVGVSEAGHFQDISLLYRQTLHALSSAFYEPGHFQFYYSQTTPLEEQAASQVTYKMALEKLSRKIHGFVSLSQIRDEIQLLLSSSAQHLISPAVFREGLCGLAGDILDVYCTEAARNAAKKTEIGERIRLSDTAEQCWSVCWELINECITDSRAYGIHTADMLEAYVTQNYANQALTLQSVSKCLGISKRALASSLYEKTGVHFRQYLNEFRIHRAMELLENTSLRVNEIAERVGYTNVEHFSRLFTTQLGLPPSAYATKKREASPGNTTKGL